MVTAGFKKCGAAERLMRRPCVVFVVRRKGAVAEPAQHLPRWLVTFAADAGQRLPYALPTDVQHAAGFAGARAHASSLWFDVGGGSAEFGSAACAVRLRTPQGSQTCLLSAAHVFTPRADVEVNDVSGGLPARPFDAAGARLQAPLLAQTLPAGGRLRGEEDPLRPSFDVQLARIGDAADERAAAAAVVGARRLFAAEPWVRSLQHLVQLTATRPVQILVSPNHRHGVGRAPLVADLEAPLTPPQGIDYDLRRGNTNATVRVFHDELLKLKMQSATNPLEGDSGSAVVLLRSDDTVTLVGLYIGGNGSAAYVIPAWQLFELARWRRFPAGASVEPMSI